MKTFGCFVCKAFLLGVASLALLSGCSLLPSVHPRLTGNRAFIVYWPPATNSSPLKLAVKDNIDMKGVATTAGSKRLAQGSFFTFYASKAKPAEKDAPCLAIARKTWRMAERITTVRQVFPAENYDLTARFRASSEASG